jgi:hypothetical protein
MGVLEFGATSQVEPVAGAHALRTWVNNLFLPDPSPEARRAAFEAASRLAHALPALKLTFAPDASAAQTLRETLLERLPIPGSESNR